MLPNKHFLKFHVSERKHSIAAFFLMVGDTKLARDGVCVTLKNTKRWFLDMNRKRWGLEPYKEPSCTIPDNKQVCKYFF